MYIGTIYIYIYIYIYYTNKARFWTSHQSCYAKKNLKILFDSYTVLYYIIYPNIAKLKK